MCQLDHVESKVQGPKSKVSSNEFNLGFFDLGNTRREKLLFPMERLWTLDLGLWTQKLVSEHRNQDRNREPQQSLEEEEHESPKTNSL